MLSGVKDKTSVRDSGSCPMASPAVHVSWSELRISPCTRPSHTLQVPNRRSSHTSLSNVPMRQHYCGKKWTTHQPAAQLPHLFMAACGKAEAFACVDILVVALKVCAQQHPESAKRAARKHFSKNNRLRVGYDGGGAHVAPYEGNLNKRY
eukprot:6180485-Pleurochrysis_carterae.AAC.2